MYQVSPYYRNQKETITTPHLGDFDIYLMTARNTNEGDATVLYLAIAMTESGPIAEISADSPEEAANEVKHELYQLDADAHANEQARLWAWNKRQKGDK